MELQSAGFLGAIIWGILLIMVIAICLMLFTLAKQGDERKSLIKGKAMSKTLLVVIGILVIQIFISRVSNYQLEGINPLIFLTIISVVFLVMLGYYKRHFGG